jgi:hypothetical protein
MIKIRKVENKDLQGIANLYKVCFNLSLDFKRYDFWYKKDNIYTSIVAEDNDGIIVGHNAFVVNKYLYQGDEITVSLSSGGMVDNLKVKSPGLFLLLIKATISNFTSDLVIAFPNKNANVFWTKILKYKTLTENYYSITPHTLNLSFNKEVIFDWRRTNDFIQFRSKNNWKNTYEYISIGDFELIYKVYNDNIELFYINKISKEFIQALSQIFHKGYKKANIISIYGKELIEAGFYLSKHNDFVMEWINKKYEGAQFECQMIDSDVF